MAENYKHLYQQMKLIVAKYQDELIPGFRKKIEELEKNQVKVRCKGCKYWERLTDGNLCGACNGHRNGLTQEYTTEDDFCSYGERRTDDAEN